MDLVQTPVTFALPMEPARTKDLETALDTAWVSEFVPAFAAMPNVHAARFSILHGDDGWARLLVTVTQDGPAQVFVERLARALEHEFAALCGLEPAADATARARQMWWYAIPTDRVYAAYPGRTVGEIQRALNDSGIVDLEPPAGGRDRGDGTDGLQNLLTLVMPVEMALLDQLPRMLEQLQPLGKRSTFQRALDKVGTVHATRFILLVDPGTPPTWARFAVAATYDGEFDDYIKAFSVELNDEFNALLAFIADRPARPVRDNFEEFLAYVRTHAAQPIYTYSAYPNVTALDVWHATRLQGDGRPVLFPADVAPLGQHRRSPDLPRSLTAQDVDDVQGLVVRGYRMRRARHVLLRIDDVRAFKRRLKDLVDERVVSGPFITVASDWRDKEPVGERASHCVNLALTFPGLGKLGVPQASLAAFPEAFRAGAPARAVGIRDDDPQTWDPLFRSSGDAYRPSPELHAVLTLHADDLAELDCRQRQIVNDAGVTALVAYDATMPADGRVHFGFQDGLSQPSIAGAPKSANRYQQAFPDVPAGEFVLGHSGVRDTHLVPPFANNGSFAAFRVMRQHQSRWEQYLADESAQTGLPRALIAAKLCGRWYNGQPLVRVPDQATPAISGLNDFDYEPDDPDGLRCPFGAHIRRAFPRSQRVVDDFEGTQRRLVRRAMPYGPPYDPDAYPADADPERERNRGLVGLFICASLEEQFEYIMRNWLKGGFSGRGLAHTQDPLTGHSGRSGPFRIPLAGNDPVKLRPAPELVSTIGSAYVFLPAKTALQALAHIP